MWYCRIADVDTFKCNIFPPNFSSDRAIIVQTVEERRKKLVMADFGPNRLRPNPILANLMWAILPLTEGAANLGPPLLPS